MRTLTTVRLLLVLLLLASCTSGPRGAGLAPPSRAYTLGPWALHVLTPRQLQFTCSNVVELQTARLGCVSAGTRTIYSVDDFWILMHELKHAVEGDWHGRTPAGRLGPRAPGEPIGPQHVGLGPRASSYALGAWRVHVVGADEIGRVCAAGRGDQPDPAAAGCTDVGGKVVHTVENFWVLVREMQHALAEPERALHASR